MKVEDIVAILNKHPALKDRVSTLLSLVENIDDENITADGAEMRTISELRQMGSEVMHGWANNKSEKATSTALTDNDFKKKK